MGCLARVAVERGFAVERGDCGSANGRTDYLARTVRVRPDIDDAQAVKTLAHEVGHVLLHDPGDFPATPGSVATPGAVSIPRTTATAGTTATADRHDDSGGHDGRLPRRTGGGGGVGGLPGHRRARPAG
jgi:hypothetical protein